MCDAGLRGIESGYTAHSKEQTRFFRGIAKRFGLINTKGSDYHSGEKPPMDYTPEDGAAELLGIRD